MMRIRLTILLILVALIGSWQAQARINVVTLPARDTVQLTIYNSADLTLVKETRHLTFREGNNRLEFSWANTLIDPTSLEFRAITHADEVEVLDVRFPPRVTNTLEWRIRSEFAGEVEVEIRYFTSGISWSADYVAEAATKEDVMALAGHVRVNNKSGEDYENAQVRLVVGVIRLVEDIAALAKQGRPGPLPRPGQGQNQAQRLALGDEMRFARYAGRAKNSRERQQGQVKDVAKESLSEYFLYTVEGRDTIPNGWSKRLPSFRKEDVPITSFYKYEKERFGNRVIRYYRFTNAVPSKLGSEPLPDGLVQAFRIVNDDNQYQYVGRTQTKYIPIDETVDLELGNDPEVMVRPKLMNWEKIDIRKDASRNISGWTIRQAWQIEVQNSREIPVVLDIRRNFAGDWDMESDDNFEKVDATKVKFLVKLKPGEKKTLSYTLTTRHGVNVKK